ncbi:MAG: hypothetical protein VXA50_08675 [bacterium]
MRISIILTIIISLQNVNCGTKNNIQEFPELVFRYDKSLLSPMINFKSLSLSMPLNFEPVSGDKYLSIEKKLEADKDNFFNTDVLSIYQNDDGQVIFVSKINESKNIFSRLNKKFESILIESFNASETNRGQFLINDKESVQFITTNDDYVNYKLYFNVLSKNCYLIDYFTPIENFVKFQPIMESSMSTITIK